MSSRTEVSMVDAEDITEASSDGWVIALDRFDRSCYTKKIAHEDGILNRI